ncbi:hypothetical protein K490DRAFT_62078 [Saccharata proteae CBS 121410]|uniref:Uncharacterized protein n=1 Tax=Saccharata proteae CBS 121410 TaxID=1314787 RepID=A0A9P4M2C8_9PEZI|nr:hypothetical protein K490DRAFT_62078 [Saccharata proteae CBS 121410]
MVDVRLPENFQQWTLDKNYHRTQHSDGSTASTPDLDDSERIRISPGSPRRSHALESKEPIVLQERYLSSEEDLSPVDRESSGRLSLEEDGGQDEETIPKSLAAVQSQQASAGAGRQVEAPKAAKLAVAVSYVSAGRAKVVDVSEKGLERERSYSVPAIANAVPILKSPVPRMSRMSFGNYRPPISVPEQRRISIVRAPASEGSITSAPAHIIANRKHRMSSMPAPRRPSLARSPLSFDPDASETSRSTSAQSLRLPRNAKYYSMAMPASVPGDQRPVLKRSTTDLGAQPRACSPDSDLSRADSPFSHMSRSESPFSIEAEPIPAPFATERRPSSARSSYSQTPHSKRVSAVHIRKRSGSMQLPADPSSAPNAPLTPLTPGVPAFLNSDPFATSKEQAVEVPRAGTTHKRLRSISRTLSLARIAVLPQNKKGQALKTKAKSNRDSASLLSPVSPMTHVATGQRLPPTPMTPGTPAVIPSPALSAAKSPRRKSIVQSIHERESILDHWPVPRTLEAEDMSTSPKSKNKMVARGANERAPLIELPPFPSEELDGSGEPISPRRRLRKRRSTLGFI